MEMEMETGRKRKEKRRRKKKNGKKELIPFTSIEFSGKWSELPELALHSILHRLLSVPDLLSFTSVCRSWRSLPRPNPNSLPPLLLLSQSPLLSSPLHRNRRPSWSHTTLQTLTLDSFPSNLPTQTLTRLPCLGYSRGHLLFLSPSPHPLLLLADVFTGELTPIPSPPPSPNAPGIALLTGSGTLLLASDSETLLYRPRAHPSWSRFDCGATSLSEFRGRVFSLDSATRLSVLDIADASLGEKLMEAQLPELSGPFLLCHDFCPRLVECGEDLMLLRFALHLLPPVRRRVDVFRLDVERSTWVDGEGLGDWCIFVDLLGGCATACPEPARWGGRSNCVYVAAGCDGWVVVPLDGHRFFEIGESNLKLHRWPSPVWVYPSALYCK